ncbi:MAG: phosphotransferase [Bacteroidia bacterium]
MNVALQLKETQLIKDIWQGIPNQVLADNQRIAFPKDLKLDWENASNGQAFSYICNPNGTIRWIFPDDQQYPVHLALYNSAHWKARGYKIATHLAFMTGQQKRLSNGKLWLGEFEQSSLAKAIGQVEHDGYAIFTGTVGENRKGIVAINQGNQTTHFLKIPLTEESFENVANEAEILNQIQAFELQTLIVPEVKHIAGQGSVLLSNVRPKDGREGNRLAVSHIKALEELYATTKRSARLGNLSYYQEIAQNMKRIRLLDFVDQSLNPRQIMRIVNRLDIEFARLSPDESVKVAWAHGDFTSWNMYHSEKALHVYDWELARPDMPILYDAFHYLIQTGVLLRRQSNKQIEKELLRAQRLPGMQALLEQYGLNFEEQLRRYLLHLVSYYLRIYMDEPKLHMQVQWLLDCWDYALNRNVK